MNLESRRSSSRGDMAIIAGLTLPFLLNDFSNIFVKDYRIWLTIDYVFVKAVPLVLLGCLLRARKISYADLGLKSVPVGSFIIWTVTMTVVGILLDQYGSRIFVAILPDTRLGGMPQITDPWLDRFDLHFGLMAVALVEEVIFRGLYFTILVRYMTSVTNVFALSSLLFGLIHWSLGVSAVAHTSIIGAVFMTCMWKTRSVLPTIIAHFCVNYIAFSGILHRL